MKFEDVKIFGDHDENTLAQIKRSAAHEAVVGAVLAADGHKGYGVPIGGVLAYEGHISPSAVGFDIGCGNKACCLDIPASEVRGNLKAIMDDVWRTLDFGIGRKNSNDGPTDHPLFDSDLWHGPLLKPLKQMAQGQLGTIGSGNHYVDLFSDEQDRAWVGVHFGSRGLGHKTATHFLKAGGASDSMDAEPLVLAMDTDLGRDYYEHMVLAGRYAYAGRDWVCDKIASMLGASVVESVHNHHNFCIAGDQKIPTPDGPKRMRDIAAGDTVYAFDEAAGLVETLVSDHWCSGQKQTYTLRTRSRELSISGTHPVLIIRTQEKPHPERPWFSKGQGCFIWTKAAEVQPGDALVCASGYYKNEHSVGEELARFIGAYLGDGWLRHTNPEVSGYSVGLAIGAAGDAHTEKYADLCRTLYPQATWRSNMPGAFGVTCSSKEVYQSLMGLGIGCRSQEKHVPHFAYTLSLHEKLALLAGYFDADGSVASEGTSNYGRGSLCGVGQELIEGLRELAISCGMQITPISREERITNFGPCTAYRCTMSADSMGMLELWHEGKSLKQRMTQHRKNQGLQASKLGYINLPEGVFAQTVTDIAVSEQTEAVYDLTVEHESHSFICEGIVVHNCWQEAHRGQDLWVVRKGATPAFPGQRGFVGGSMGDNSVILEGVASQEADEALHSTVHGAGRVMSRTQARGKINYKTKQVIALGQVSREMMMEWIGKLGVELRGAGTDESPQAYKRLPEVLAYHRNSVRILHTLTPLGVAMAGENEHDPFKD